MERRFLIGALDAAGQVPWLREFGAGRDGSSGIALAGWPISAADLIERYLRHRGLADGGTPVEVREDRHGSGVGSA